MKTKHKPRFKKNNSMRKQNKPSPKFPVFQKTNTTTKKKTKEETVPRRLRALYPASAGIVVL